MDFLRSGSTASRWSAGATVSLLAVLAVVAINLSFSRFFPNIPSVDSRTVVFDSVRRGEFVHEVRSVGQLVSEEITMRSAETKARVARIVTLPGIEVEPDTLLLELANPELEMALNDAESELGVTEAEFVTQTARLDSERLQLESAWRKFEADHAQAEAKYNVSLELWQKNHDAVPLQQLNAEKMAAASFLKQRDLSEQAHTLFRSSIANHLAIYKERIAQANTNLKRETARKNSLHVLAGVEGVLAQVPVTVGQQLEAGELLAKIVNPRKLKAELRVAEVESRYIRVGQPAKVDAHHGVIPGTVIRIDPEVVDGSVTIDVSFGGKQLPAEVRPDLSVIGTIEVNRLQDVLWTGRPASAMAVSTGSIFRCSESERAFRTPVKFGIASANAIVIREGLQAGDRVILSDMSKFEDISELILD